MCMHPCVILSSSRAFAINTLCPVHRYIFLHATHALIVGNWSERVRPLDRTSLRSESRDEQLWCLFWVYMRARWKRRAKVHEIVIKFDVNSKAGTYIRLVARGRCSSQLIECEGSAGTEPPGRSRAPYPANCFRIQEIHARRNNCWPPHF